MSNDNIPEGERWVHVPAAPAEPKPLTPGEEKARRDAIAMIEKHFPQKPD
jgi:hypothetical protein